MDVASTAVRLVLAVAFALAAGAKVLDRRGTRHAVAEFGVRGELASVLTWMVPAVEAAVATGLLINRTAVGAAVVGAALMLAFGLAIGRVLRQGRTPDCNCFGQLHSAPVGWRMLARNAVFGSAAVFVASAGPGDAISAWLVAAAAAAVCGLLLRSGRGRARAAPRVGDSAPAVEGRDANGRRVSLEHMLEDGLPITVVFVSSDCGPCRNLVPELERWRSAIERRLTLLTVDEGLDAFGVTATPSALVVASDGRVASGTATGIAGVEALVRSQLASGHAAEM